MAANSYDAVVVGSGPNGLSAAIVLAQAGRSVIVYEAEETIGGGTRSAPLTLPGFTHDLCSAIHPLALSSPFFRSLPLAEYGLRWIQPPVPLAHPMDDGTAALLFRSLGATSERLGKDGDNYRRLIGAMVRNWDNLVFDLLGPLRLPSDPLQLIRFGLNGMRSGRALMEKSFESAKAQALFGGLAAHSMLPLEHPMTAAFGLVLGASAHAAGWPFPEGGAQRIADALTGYLRKLGGEIVVGKRVDLLAELPPSRAVLCDITPRQLLKLAGDRLPGRYRSKLERYRYGMGAFKIDWALSDPIPWRAKECGEAGTVHLGGTFEEIAASERAAWTGAGSVRPFVLLAQPSLFDSTRAPAGRHTAWAYCHVPNGSEEDMTLRIESQIERFAPGFQDCVIAKKVHAPADLERHNMNLVGGDINGGAATLAQLFLRPTRRLYSTPLKGLYLCSASTPPGGGVHGMCGYFAAQRALRELWR